MHSNWGPSSIISIAGLQQLQEWPFESSKQHECWPVLSLAASQMFCFSCITQRIFTDIWNTIIRYRDGTQCQAWKSGVGIASVLGKPPVSHYFSGLIMPGCTSLMCCLNISNNQEEQEICLPVSKHVGIRGQMGLHHIRTSHSTTPQSACSILFLVVRIGLG